jgi:hypothetical protein
LDVRLRETEGRVRDIELDVVTLKEWQRSVIEQIKTFVTRSEFGPVKMIAYGLAGTVMASVLTAVVAKVIVE